jgi:hypothetical protein
MLQRAKSPQRHQITDVEHREHSRLNCTEVAMQYVQDSYHPGSIVGAWLTPGTLGGLEPVLRRLMAGHQLFVKQPDGTYRPKGSELGLARHFDFADLQEPALRDLRT